MSGPINHTDQFISSLAIVSVSQRREDIYKMCWLWMLLLGFFGLIFLALLGLKLYIRMKLGICTSTADMSGKTVIVTGANTGIGYYTALDLARRNARVILACRSRQRGQAPIDKIIAATGNSKVCLKLVDLSVMKSVRGFAEEIMKNEDRLDVLVNNAGLSGLPKRTLTEEGLEEQFAANYFGPFLLTNLLLDKLKQSAPSRIVNVSSMAHKWNRGFDFDNLKSEKSYNIARIYYQSKLGNVLFTRELARRLEGTDVDIYCAHPGVVHTEMNRHLPTVLDTIYKLAFRPFLKSAEEGAQTSIYCAVSDEVKGQSGKYYQECKEAEEHSSELSKDMGLAKKLWEVSEKITGLVEDKSE